MEQIEAEAKATKLDFLDKYREASLARHKDCCSTVVRSSPLIMLCHEKLESGSLCLKEHEDFNSLLKCSCSWVPAPKKKAKKKKTAA